MPAPEATSGAESSKTPAVEPAPTLPPAAAPEAPAPKTSAQPKAAAQGADPTPETEPLLRIHSRYATLYIDRYGGVYSADTPKCVRGEATLYRNPHYKSDKH